MIRILRDDFNWTTNFVVIHGCLKRRATLESKARGTLFAPRYKNLSQPKKAQDGEDDNHRSDKPDDIHENLLVMHGPGKSPGTRFSLVCVPSGNFRAAAVSVEQSARVARRPECNELARRRACKFCFARMQLFPIRYDLLDRSRAGEMEKAGYLLTPHWRTWYETGWKAVNAG